ncbi:hypothetical protein AAE478_000969 [Parahypoxylon ruwenzoriense]
MCFFPYPAPKPAPKSRRSKKARWTATRKTTRSADIEEAARRAADEVLNQAFPTMPLGQGANPMYYYPSRNYYGYGWEQWPGENQPGYTQSQWASQGETLKEALDTAKLNGRKIDEAKSSVYSGIMEARDAAKLTHGAVQGTHATVKDIHDSLKETREAIGRNHGEYARKQDGCAAEIGKVRRLLEEEAKKRDEAHQRQQYMQEAWNYAQRLRQEDRDGEPKPSRSSHRSQSSGGGSSSSSNGKQRRRRRPSVDSYDSEERRRRQDEELKRTVLGYLNEVLSGSQPRAAGDQAEGPRESHNHFYAYPPPHAPPPWAGPYPAGHGGSWQQPYSPFPGRDGFYEDAEDHGGDGRRGGLGGGIGAPRPSFRRGQPPKYM